MATKSAGAGGRIVRVLIVDDHPIVRRGLAELIDQEPDLEVCGEASDAPEALQQVRATHPDVVVVDIALKSGNGIELIKQIKACDSDIKMLVSSMHDESLYAERALRAGAMGYINKREAVDKVIDAIRNVLRDKIYLSGRMTDRVLHQMREGGSIEQSAVDRLSDRELEVFELIGQGLGTRQIASKLHVSVKTVESYREHIKIKLDLQSGTELTHHAVKWVLEKG